MTNHAKRVHGKDVMTQPVRREFIGFDGGRLVADAYGDPAGPAILFAHGGGQTRHAWSESARVLAERGWYSVALDMRGHGESAWSADGDYLIDTVAEEMRGIFRELGRPLVAVGASMGGLISLAAAGYADVPLIDGLILVDVAPRTEQRGVERILRFMRGRPDGFASLEEAADYIAAYRNKPPPSNLEGIKKNLRLNAQGRWIWHWDPLVIDDRNMKRRHDPDFLMQAARKLRMPTLLVRGNDSDVLSEDGVHEFMNLIPHSRYANLKDAGHMVTGDTNDAFVRSILEFLDDVLPTGQIAVPLA